MMQVFPADFAVTTFDTARPAVDLVEVGEYFEVETHDCYDGQVTGPDVLRPMIDMTRFNRATGPIDIAGVRVPVRPMIGVIGVAAEEPISSSTPGRHGGNTDTRIITAGSEVLLRAQRDGAGLGLGDLHAAQGDGELGGLLMGYGARLSFGCNIGAYLAGIASFSLSGWVWAVVALTDTWIGLGIRRRMGLATPAPGDGIC